METLLILDFGGTNSQLIARRVRRINVYCEILPFSVGLERIKSFNPSGIILSGGNEEHIYNANAPLCDKGIFSLGVPVLGIGYGMHVIASLLGGEVKPTQGVEFITVETELSKSDLFEGFVGNSAVYMNYSDNVTALPEGFKPISSSYECTYAGMENEERKIYGIQFFPEIAHTEMGKEIIRNFALNICKCKGDWTMKYFAEDSIKKIREEVGGGKVLLGISGGVDSAVTAALLHQAIGDKLYCVFVDHGLMRKNEPREIVDYFASEKKINLIFSDSGDRFLAKLKGVVDPETKRKIIGEEFIRVFEEEAKKIGKVEFLAQGTIYPDIIESGAKGGKGLVKSHHNVGGLPDVIEFNSLIEPLKYLFKEDVRKLGKELGLPVHLYRRQPFPGPGLGVRVVGEITREKLEIVRNADAIVREEIIKAGFDKSASQYFAVLTGLRSVGIKNEERSYDYTVAVRAIITDDFMTADWVRIPHDILGRISSRIVSEVDGVNRVVYDITSKPPSSIEWE